MALNRRARTTSGSSFRFSETSPDNCNLTNNSIPVPFPFSARMVHSRQSRTERPFQPVFRGGKQRFSVLWTAGFRKGRGFVIGERKRMVQNPPACPTNYFPQPIDGFSSVGCFVSANLLKLRNLCEFSVSSNPTAEKDKRPFQPFLQTFFRRFSPFEKTADFSPKSTFSASRRRYSPFFS